MFPSLNFPEYALRIKKEKNAYLVFDICRKFYVALTPEEWVRQHLIHYLVEEKNFPQSLMQVEKSITLNGTTKRMDLIVLDNKLIPLLIAECKAPEIEINQSTLDQALRYNLPFSVPFIALTNGLKHHIIEIIPGSQKPSILSEYPDYKVITSKD